MKRVIWLTLSVFCLFAVNGQQLQKTQIKKLDRLIADQYAAISPGCAVLVAQKDNVVYRKAFGTADLELNVVMQPEMVFRIGSMTKQFTAVAILKLYEEGKLRLSDNIQKYIPRLRHEGEAVTIEHLLTHTSGFVDYGLFNAGIPNAIRIEFSPQTIVDSLSNRKLDFVPGSRYEYSNSNYFLLGLVIENASGLAYKDYLKQHLFSPLQLNNTYYEEAMAIIPGRVSGYVKDSSRYLNADYISMSLVYAAGALRSNVDDLLTWHRILQEGKVIRRETLDRALSKYKLSDGTMSQYGYGWFIREIAGNSAFGHGGAIDGFRSMAAYFPARDIYLVMLFNSDNDAFNGLFDSVTNMLLGDGSGAVSAGKDVKLADSLLNRFVGIYEMKENPGNKITIRKEGGQLFADLSNKTGNNLLLQPRSETVFDVPQIRRVRTTIEFIVQNGVVTGLYANQDKRYEARKVE